MAEKKKKTNPVVSYFKDVKGEMKKVAWPTFKQIKNNTVIVIVSVVIVGLVIALLDFGFGKGFDYLVNRDNNKATQKTTQDAGNINVTPDVNGDAKKVETDGNADSGADADASSADDTQAGENDGE